MDVFKGYDKSVPLQTRFDNIADHFYMIMFGLKDSFHSEGYKGFNLFGMYFKFIPGKECFKLVDYKYNFIEVICIVRSIFRYMDSINKRGYVTESVLKNTFMKHIMKFLEGYMYEFKILGNSELTYTMWYNFVFINAYYLVIRCLRSLRVESYESIGLSDIDEKIELIDLLDSLRVDLLSRMDQFLKMQFQKRGITVIQNTYCGFDTEYASVDSVKMLNKIVSAQTAIQERTIVKIPLYNPYDISYVNPLTSEVSNVFLNRVNSGDSDLYCFESVEDKVVDPDVTVDEFGVKYNCDGERVKKLVKLNEVFMINVSLKACVKTLRGFLFSDLYDYNAQMIQHFKFLSKLAEFEGSYFYEDYKRDQFVFFFPLGPMRTKIVYPAGDFLLNDLFNMCGKSHFVDDCADCGFFSANLYSNDNNFSNFSSTFDRFLVPSNKTSVLSNFRGGGLCVIPAPAPVPTHANADVDAVAVANADAKTLTNTNTITNTNILDLDVDDLNTIEPINYFDYDTTNYNYNTNDNREKSTCGAFIYSENVFDDGVAYTTTDTNDISLYTTETTDITNSSTTISSDDINVINDSETMNMHQNNENFYIDEFGNPVAFQSSDHENDFDYENENVKQPEPEQPEQPEQTHEIDIDFENLNNKVNKNEIEIESEIGSDTVEVTEDVTGDVTGEVNTNTNTNTDTDKRRNDTKYKVSSLTEDFIYILKILSTNNFEIDLLKKFKWFKKSENKPSSRTKVKLKVSGEEDLFIPLTIVKNFYIIAHYNSADLPMISNFDEVFKDHVSIIGKSYATLRKPIKSEKFFLHVRDTILLAPAGYNSLKALGYLYKEDGDFEKREISQHDLNNIQQFLERDKKAFDEYALQDSKITLKHAIAMEKFNMTVNQIGIPLTLSSIGRNYVKSEWLKIFKKFIPYQISSNFKMGNANELQTPKALDTSKEIGTHISYFIANYKGGRNESFMYGVDEETRWFDYDLTSAYTTGMVNLPLPDYNKGSLINCEDLDEWPLEKFLTGYLIIHTEFKFPGHVKYPSIPVYVDKGTTVYPLEGVGYLTGPEYLLAKQQECVFNMKSAFYIEPKTKSVFNHKNKEFYKVEIKPFQHIINDIQGKRRIHPKGTVDNALYKEMGNSIYGNIVRGMSDKKTFDNLSGEYIRVEATDLSNPILASWITAFIRSVIGECLHNIHKLGGKIVSVTTDGFITDIDNLEEKLLTLPEDQLTLLNKYRSLRMELTQEDTTPDTNALELKKDGKGVISWTTRGQLGIETGMTATTGFQRPKKFDKPQRDELVNQFKELLKSKDKFFEYTRKSLRGASDIYKKGGHVTTILKDQVFRLLYDNRRSIIEPKEFGIGVSVDLSDKMLDSKPLKDKKQCKTLRFLSKFPTTKPFNKNNANKSPSTYKTCLEVGVRNFIKAYYSKNEKFGFKGNEFKRVKDIIDFIYCDKQTRSIKITTQSISKLRNRKLCWRQVPKTVENLQLAGYIKMHFPNFREDLFLE